MLLSPFLQTGVGRGSLWDQPGNWIQGIRLGLCPPSLMCFPFFPGHTFYKWLKGNPWSEHGCSSWGGQGMAREWVGSVTTLSGIRSCLRARRIENPGGAFSVLKCPSLCRGVCGEKSFLQAHLWSPRQHQHPPECQVPPAR